MGNSYAIAANNLSYRKIMYFYEKPLMLKAYNEDNSPKFIRPDFTIIVNNKLYYMEILGMMNNEIYNDNLRRRITEYELLGIELGKDLICIVVENGKEINCQKLDEIIINLKNNIVPAGVVDLGIGDVRTGQYKVKSF